MPYEVVRGMVVERTGWSLEYVDGLDVHELLGLLRVWARLDEARQPRRKGSK